MAKTMALVGFLVLLPAALWADTELTYSTTSPVMMGVGGQATGGKEKHLFLVGADRVRDERSILRQDQGAFYSLRPVAKTYCKLSLPIRLDKELPADLYANLQLYPQDDGPPTVEVSALGAKTIGRFKTEGHLIVVHNGENSWVRTSVWMTEDLPAAVGKLLSERSRAEAALFRNRGSQALALEIAKLPGVLVRREEKSKSSMVGEYTTSMELVSVVERAAQKNEYEPPKDFKKVELMRVLF